MHSPPIRLGRRLVLGGLGALTLFAGFVFLGTWQLERRAWKLERIADVDARANAAAVPAPGPSRWPRVGSGTDRYRRVRVAGHYLNNGETLVHGTSRLGYGYWVMTPLRTDRGFIVLINRGHIPESLPGTPEFRAMMRPTGRVEITGLLRLPRPDGGVFRSNDPSTGRWYSRDVAAIAEAAQLSANRVAPYFIDAGATGNDGGWPVGGLTVIRFPNHHLIYAITWYAMAVGVIAAAGIAIGRRRMSASLGA